MQSALLSLLSLAALVAAVPSAQVTPGPFANKRALTQATVIVVNSMPSAVSTSMTSNVGVPTLVAGGDKLIGTMEAGATATMVFQAGFHGSFAYGSANETLTMPSLIEPNLDVGGKPGIDVSYVNGFTVPIICYCGTNIGTDPFQSGCSKDLFSEAGKACDQQDEKLESGSCINPTNMPNFSAKAASPFFESCAGKAYTFPGDNDAMAYDRCPAGVFSCCIGSEADGCPATPAQGRVD